MAAVSLLAPIFSRINSHFTTKEREEAFSKFTSIYGHSDQENLVALLQVLARENKITPANTGPLEEGLTEDEKTKEAIRATLNQFKNEKRTEIDAWSKRQPREFVGRDVTWLGRILEEKIGVILWGASGVGKTKLAKMFMESRSDITTITVDLRGIQTIELICVETLKCFGKLVSLEDASINLLSREISKYVSSKSTILLLDNADEFVSFPGDGQDLTGQFSKLVQSILRSTEGNLKLIITSRKKSSDPNAEEFLHQEQLSSLRDEDASQIIKSKMIHGLQPDNDIAEASKHCHKLPLNLKIVAAALRDQGVSLKDIVKTISREAAQWKTKKQQEKVSLPEEDFYTYGVLSDMFDRLSDTVQQTAVALSLFTRSFTFKSVEAILPVDRPRMFLSLDHLKGVNFISMEKDNDNKDEIVFDMHPKVREFLSSKSNLEFLQDFYQNAKKMFINYFKEQLASLSQLMDTDYLKAYEQYQADNSNFEFVLTQGGSEMVLYENYDDIQLVATLLRAMLDAQQRLTIFRNLAQTAFQQRKRALGTHFLCQIALVEAFHNPVEALQYTLLRAEHSLRTGKMVDATFETRQGREIEPLCRYTKGDLLYNIAHSNMSMEDCDDGIEALKKSMELREILYPNGHSDLVRTYMNMGNLFNMKEDINREERRVHLLERCLNSALEYYEKARIMRERLSGGSLHIDSPTICQNIGTVWYEKGRVLFNEGKDDEVVDVCFDKAVEFFERSLEMDKELKLDDLFPTSTKLINLGDLYKQRRNYNEAFTRFIKAADIRRALKGDHKDTVLAVYRMATIKHSTRDYREAIRYYKEAFEMEERLPHDYHSAVRFDIRKFWLRALDLMAKREGSLAEKSRLTDEREELERLFNEMDKKEKERLDEPMLVEESLEGGEAMTISETVTQEISSSGSLNVVGRFEKSGGYADFDYFHVYLTLPRNVTKSTQDVQISRVPLEEVEILLTEGEHLVSNVFAIETTGIFAVRPLSAPAMLEIRCDVRESIMEKFTFSHLRMIQYDPEDKSWKDVEKIEILPQKYYWYAMNDAVPIVQAWISRFTKFAIVMRPKVHSITVPDSGKTWSPFQDRRISLTFEPNTFDVPEAICDIKIITPDNDMLLRYAISHVVQRTGLLVSPAISVNTNATMLKAVKMTLPVSGVTLFPHSEGAIRILRREGETSTEWKILEPQPGDMADFRKGIIHLTVPKFSILMAVWSKTGEIMNLIKENEYFEYISSIFRTVYDAEFHLYKGSKVNDFLTIKVASTPMTCSKMQRDAWVTEPLSNGYILVDSASSNWRLADLQKILVEAKGQYINACKPEVEYDHFNFKSSCLCHSPISLRETGLSSGKGGSVIMTNERGGDLCKIEYMEHFVLVSDSYDKQDEAQLKEPIRFLGMTFPNCSLKNISIHASDLRNQLYKTGLPEDFIDELKLDLEAKARSKVIKKVFKRITSKFAVGELKAGWFNVFGENVHPEPIRKNLISVMDVLKKPLMDLEDANILLACIIDHPKLHKFLGSLCSNLGIAIPNYKQESAKMTWLNALNASKVNNGCLLDIVKAILLLKHDGFTETVNEILDSLGSLIENRIIIRY